MADGKEDVMDAANKVIVLAFDLTGSEIERFPYRIVQLLESPPVQSAIKKTLLDFTRSRLSGGPDNTTVTDEDARKLLASLGAGVQDPAGQQYLELIKKSPEYRSLEKSLTAFKEAAGSSSLGIWIDKNQWVLYVVGTALVVGALGTASALYITKTGGKTLDTVLDPLKGKDFQVLQIGIINVSAGLLEFKPDARTVGARIGASRQWERVSVEFKFGVIAQETQVQSIQGQALLKSGAFSVSLTNETKPQLSQVNLGLKLDYTGRIGEGKFNLGIGAMYKDQQTSATLNAGYKTGPFDIGLQGNVGTQKSGVNYGGLLTLSIDL